MERFTCLRQTDNLTSETRKNDVNSSLNEAAEKLLENYPKSIENYPKGIENYPKSIENYPTDIENYPKGIVNYPKGIGNFPKNIANYPNGIENYPKSIVNYPKGIASYPKGIEKYTKYYGSLDVCLESYPNKVSETFANYPVVCYDSFIRNVRKVSMPESCMNNNEIHDKGRQIAAIVGGKEKNKNKNTNIKKHIDEIYQNDSITKCEVENENNNNMEKIIREFYKKGEVSKRKSENDVIMQRETNTKGEILFTNKGITEQNNGNIIKQKNKQMEYQNLFDPTILINRKDIIINNQSSQNKEPYKPFSIEQNTIMNYSSEQVPIFIEESSNSLNFNKKNEKTNIKKIDPPFSYPIPVNRTSQYLPSTKNVDMSIESFENVFVPQNFYDPESEITKNSYALPVKFYDNRQSSNKKCDFNYESERSLQDSAASSIKSVGDSTTSSGFVLQELETSGAKSLLKSASSGVKSLQKSESSSLTQMTLHDEFQSLTFGGDKCVCVNPGTSHACASRVSSYGILNPLFDENLRYKLLEKGSSLVTKIPVYEDMESDSLIKDQSQLTHMDIIGVNSISQFTLPRIPVANHTYKTLNPTTNVKNKTPVRGTDTAKFKGLNEPTNFDKGNKPSKHCQHSPASKKMKSKVRKENVERYSFISSASGEINSPYVAENIMEELIYPNTYCNDTEIIQNWNALETDFVLNTPKKKPRSSDLPNKFVREEDGKITRVEETNELQEIDRSVRLFSSRSKSTAVPNNRDQVGNMEYRPYNSRAKNCVRNVEIVFPVIQENHQLHSDNELENFDRNEYITFKKQMREVEQKIPECLRLNRVVSQTKDNTVIRQSRSMSGISSSSLKPKLNQINPQNILNRRRSIDSWLSKVDHHNKKDSSNYSMSLNKDSKTGNELRFIPSNKHNTFENVRHNLYSQDSEPVYNSTVDFSAKSVNSLIKKQPNAIDSPLYICSNTEENMQVRRKRVNSIAGQKSSISSNEGEMNSLPNYSLEARRGSNSLIERRLNSPDKRDKLKLQINKHVTGTRCKGASYVTPNYSNSPERNGDTPNPFSGIINEALTSDEDEMFYLENHFRDESSLTCWSDSLSPNSSPPTCQIFHESSGSIIKDAREELSTQQDAEITTSSKSVNKSQEKGANLIKKSNIRRENKPSSPDDGITIFENPISMEQFSPPLTREHLTREIINNIIADKRTPSTTSSSGAQSLKGSSQDEPEIPYQPLTPLNDTPPPENRKGKSETTKTAEVEKMDTSHNFLNCDVTRQDSSGYNVGDWQLSGCDVIKASDCDSRGSHSSGCDVTGSLAMGGDVTKQSSSCYDVRGPHSSGCDVATASDCDVRGAGKDRSTGAVSKTSSSIAAHRRRYRRPSPPSSDESSSSPSSSSGGSSADSSTSDSSSDFEDLINLRISGNYAY